MQPLFLIFRSAQNDPAPDSPGMAWRVSLAGGGPLWMNLGPEPGIYLARVEWLTDGALIAARNPCDLLRFPNERHSPRSQATHVTGLGLSL